MTLIQIVLLVFLARLVFLASFTFFDAQEIGANNGVMPVPCWHKTKWRPVYKPGSMSFFSQHFHEQLQTTAAVLFRGALWCLARLSELSLDRQTMVKLGKFGYAVDLLLWRLHRYLPPRHIWTSQARIMVKEQQENPPGPESSSSKIRIFKACYCLLLMN